MADVQALLQALAGANVASNASATELLQQLQEQAKSLLQTGPEPVTGPKDAAENAISSDGPGTSKPRAISSSAAAFEHSETQKQCSNHCDHTVDVAILQASPLVLLGDTGRTDAGGNASVTPRPVAPLELATERRLIIKSLKESTRALQLVVAPATLDSLQRVWMVGSHLSRVVVLHFTSVTTGRCSCAAL